VIAAENVEWGYLNPLRGKLSPGAANLWGDRTTDDATGMLVRFNKGFESPPHIHNITYRGVVINGLLHNAAPKAEKFWMPTGSYWTQPAGHNHTTAANSESNLIYLEIESGPYLVLPSKEAFDNGEKALNLHRDNIVWLESEELSFVHVEGVKVTRLWKSADGISGSLVKLPARTQISLLTSATEFRVVQILGTVDYHSKDWPKTQLAPGSYIESTGEYAHVFNNTRDTDSVIYIRKNDAFTIK